MNKQYRKRIHFHPKKKIHNKILREFKEKKLFNNDCLLYEVLIYEKSVRKLFKSDIWFWKNMLWLWKYIIIYWKYIAR